LTLAFFDGDYANQLDIIQISDSFDILLAEKEVEGDVITLRQNNTAMKAGLFNFENWDMTSKHTCLLDVMYKKVITKQTATTTSEEYTIYVSDST